MATEFNFDLNQLSKKLIASGGGGKIFDIGNNLVLKYFHIPESSVFEDHLESLKQLPNNFIKPVEIYKTGKKIVGYSMPFVDFNKYFLFNNLFNKNFCKNNKIDLNFKIQLLKSIKKDMEDLHSKNIVIGDHNQYNSFFNLKGEYVFVDTDSYQTSFQKHSGVLLEDIQDFLNPISFQSDMWSFSILSFWAMSHIHPFKWVLPGNKDTLEQRVRLKESILNKTGIIIPPIYEKPSLTMEPQFKEIFNGRRFFLDFDNNSSVINIQIPSIVNSISMNIMHMMKDVYSIEGNSDFLIVKSNEYHLLKLNQKRSFSLMNSSKQRLVTNFEGKTVEIDENVVDTIFVKENRNFYFNNSLVSVSSEDELFCFDLNLQMAGLFYSKQNTISKSIILRDSLIQDFGAQKYVIKPNKSASLLVPVKFTTKNAYLNGDYIMIEYLEKNKTKYSLINVNTKTEIDLPYYAYFCQIGANIAIPNDGKIDIINEKGSLIASLDINICTKTSKILNTTSGIVMLENNNLYLLNTK